MDEMEKKDAPIPFEEEKGRRPLRLVLVIVLAVLILLNIVLLILYFALDGQEKKDASAEPSGIAEQTSSAEETPEETEASSSAPSSSAAESTPPSSGTESVPSSEPASSSTVSGNTTEEFGVVFDILKQEEAVTAKIFVNLRTYPGVRSDEDIAATLNHGEWATRVAVGRNGWCKVIYNGQTYYAVNSYLTTDPNWTQSTPVSNDIEEYGVTFHAVSDTVTPKETTNLRTQPTTDSEIAVTLQNGETVERTGYSDTGWSRLSWNGQTVYAVTNYLEKVE